MDSADHPKLGLQWPCAAAADPDPPPAKRGLGFYCPRPCDAVVARSQRTFGIEAQAPTVDALRPHSRASVRDRDPAESRGRGLQNDMRLITSGDQRFRVEVERSGVARRPECGGRSCKRGERDYGWKQAAHDSSAPMIFPTPRVSPGTRGSPPPSS